MRCARNGIWIPRRYLLTLQREWMELRKALKKNSWETPFPRSRGRKEVRQRHRPKRVQALPVVAAGLEAKVTSTVHPLSIELS
jgi:hypothetical protein